MNAKAQVEPNDYSIIFECMQTAMKNPDYVVIKEAISNTQEIQDPIEKLRQIVLDRDNYNYNVITTT